MYWFAGDPWYMLTGVDCIQLDFVVLKSPDNYPQRNVFWVFFMLWFAQIFWCPQRFQAFRGQLLLKAWLFIVNFLRWDWTLNGYAVLDCCVICTLHFFTFPTQTEATDFFFKSTGIHYNTFVMILES